VILGDNIFEDSLIDLRRKFEAAKKGALLVLKQVPDPARYGVAEMQNNEITNIIEKPQNPKTNLAVTGIYFYAPEVFAFVRELKPSKRGELEITDVNNGFVQKKDAAWGEFKGWWTDAGTFESLHHANELVYQTDLKNSQAATK
jgi:glucose-1-phosphate thymidylyltransferase